MAMRIRFSEFILPELRITAKKMQPAPRGSAMAMMNQSGTSITVRTSRSATTPSTATIMTSKTRSTTREENPSE